MCAYKNTHIPVSQKIVGRFNNIQWRMMKKLMVKGNRAKESKKWVMEYPATWPQTVLTYFNLNRRINFFYVFVAGRATHGGSCLMLRNELFEETHIDKARDFIKKGALRWRAGLCYVTWSLWFDGDEISFQIVSDQSFWLRVLPGGSAIAQPKWISMRRILGDQ